MRTSRIRTTGLAIAGAAVLLGGQGCGLLRRLVRSPTDLLADDAGSVNAVGLEMFADGFTAPVGLVAPGDGSGRVFIIDQIGTIHVLDRDGQRLAEHFLDLRDRTVQIGIDFGNGLVFDERGVLGLAFHPAYASNGRFFVCYNVPKGAGDPEEIDCKLRIAEFHVRGDDASQADPASERVLLEIEKPQFNHNGGQLAFGPDGYLYIGVGDGGNADDAGPGHTQDLGNAQDGSKLLGKILRIDVDSAAPYGIPEDNPFVGDPTVRDEVFALGLRNPWRFSFDQAGRLFVADVGQNLFEEVTIVEKGDNCGWNLREGGHCFDPRHPSNPAAHCHKQDQAGRPLKSPIIEQSQTEAGIAIIGGFVYRGDDLSGLSGQYVFGQWSAGFSTGAGRLYAAEECPAGTWTARELGVAGFPEERIGRFILAIGQDEAGELYVLSSGNVGPTGQTGAVHRIVPQD